MTPAPGATASDAEATPPSRLLRLYPALANPDFRLFWLGMLPATLAWQMSVVAAPYAAFTLADSATVLEPVMHFEPCLGSAHLKGQSLGPPRTVAV